MATDLREFVAEDLWLLLGIVPFALISTVGVIGLEGVFSSDSEPGSRSGRSLERERARRGATAFRTVPIV